MITIIIINPRIENTTAIAILPPLDKPEDDEVTLGLVLLVIIIMGGDELDEVLVALEGGLGYY